MTMNSNCHRPTGRPVQLVEANRSTGSLGKSEPVDRFMLEKVNRQPVQFLVQFVLHAVDRFTW